VKSLNSYFDAIVVINLDRSTARLAACQAEATKHHFTFNRFPAVDYATYAPLHLDLRPGLTNAMCGCSHSHSAVLHLAATHGWNILVLEDDFEILHDDFTARFAAAWAEVPSGWDIVYLGCGYGSLPTQRLSHHVVRVTNVKTTSSYAITARHARFMAPLMASCSGPDDILSAHNPYHNAYSLHPRLIGQRSCLSEIWGHVTHNTQSMTDPHHDAAVNQLPYDKPTT
jgi:GR25 family glycosyltransferase involved in LPS biosynthesis